MLCRNVQAIWWLWLLASLSVSAKTHCRTEDVRAGDSCRAIAVRCGISSLNLLEYNEGLVDLCPSLSSYKRVCCSPGFPPVDIPRRDPAETEVPTSGSGTVPIATGSASTPTATNNPTAIDTPDSDSGDDDDELQDVPTPADDLQPCNATFNTLEDFQSASASIPAHCLAITMLSTLSNVLNDSLTRYDDIMKNKYDKKFQLYAESIVNGASKAVSDFTVNNGDQYFTCIVSETTFCCDKCSAYGTNACKNCFKGKCEKEKVGRAVSSSQNRETISHDESLVMGHEDDTDLAIQYRDLPYQQEVRIVKVANISEPCPPDYSLRGYGSIDPYEQTVYWTLMPDVADLFYANLTNSTGISKDFIKLVRYDHGNMCAPSAKPGDTCWSTGFDYDFPQPVGYQEANVSNPKDLVMQALGNSSQMLASLQDVILDLSAGEVGLFVEDLVDAVSLPILMLTDSVDNMENVEEIGTEIEEEQKKNLILTILSAIFLVIPFVGEGVGELIDAGIVGLIRGSMIGAGAVGDTALGIYGEVTGPHNDPLAIINLVMAPLALLDVVRTAQAAALAQRLSDKVVTTLGPKVATRMKIVRDRGGSCKL
ncbi:hypothetical protein K431DRAFT_348748 [Polychaeton citri CBS 116435]|uniref:LysM domain-containing protein n=1 Tax=Polychaeton citri CBS 116435 TaxID=1314669 RepID=A0A9P4UMW4_9PEZI|nr:hypothetical protein K431DRAFT_348748 [Polychaeton citri CBS 116435]